MQVSDEIRIRQTYHKYIFSESCMTLRLKVRREQKGQSARAQISIETGSTVTTVILSAARAALIVLVPVGCSHS